MKHLGGGGRVRKGNEDLKFIVIYEVDRFLRKVVPGASVINKPNLKHLI